MSNKKNEVKTTRLEMVEVDDKRFAAEILRGNVRINMTQMAKPFGKTPKDWLRTRETKDYLRVVSRGLKCLLADLVEVRNGGTPGTNGTWCNDRRIALRFAQWLSPDFAFAVDDVLMRMMLGEKAALRPRRSLPRERGPEWTDFYTELTRCTTTDDEQTISELLHVTRKHVHEVATGRKQGYEVCRLLVECACDNRKKGVFRAEVVRDRLEEMYVLRGQLMFDFMGEED